MAKFVRVNETLKDAGDVRTVWTAIPDFKLGLVSLEDFIAVHDAAGALEQDYAKKNVELTGTKSHRDDRIRELQGLIVRFRKGIHAAYGSDSVEYGQVGCTRDSARKAPARKIRAVSETAPAVASNA